MQSKYHVKAARNLYGNALEDEPHSRGNAITTPNNFTVHFVAPEDERHAATGNNN